MNAAAIQAKVQQGQRKVQGIWSEQLQLGPSSPTPPTPVPALMGRESLTQKFVEGKGMIEVVQLAVSVVKVDLTVAPFIGQPAQARARGWRVFTVSPTQTTWEITLESPTK